MPGSTPKVHDLVFYEKQLVMTINEAQRHLIKEHEIIINALKKEDNLTVKDLHTYYYDPELNEYTKTIKTVYRYLEILENEGIVAHSGQRMTEGKRVNEKLYCLSAKYFNHSDNELTPKVISQIAYILAKATDIPSFDDATAKYTIQQFFNIQQESAVDSFVKVMEVMDQSSDTLYSENYFEDQFLIRTASQLLTLIENQQLRNILLELISLYANAKAIEE